MKKRFAGIVLALLLFQGFFALFLLQTDRIRDIVESRDGAAGYFYGLCALAAVLLAISGFRLRRLRVRRLKAHEKKLGDMVAARTRQLAEQAEKLKEMDRLKSQFFANISHEFRTPLTLIMGPLEQILSGKPEKDMAAKANLMLRNSRRLLNLIDQLLDLAKFESGKMPLKVSLQDIVSFVKSIVMCFESLARQKKVTLTFQGQEDHIPVYFDPEKMERVIINLLSNAFNYTPDGGEIRVSVCKGDSDVGYPGGCVEISVRDTGAGIPDDELPYIFDRFYRGKGSHNYDRKGAGIGLALSKDLMELHHGDIRVYGNCGDGHTRGTEFILRLPLGKEHLQVEEIAGTDKPTARRGMEPVILVVEDNADVRTYIRGCLEPGFKVEEAVDGKQGIYRAKEIIPDLIICALKTPGVDGSEVCRTLKKDLLTGHIPIIILTARVSEKSVLRGLDAGADDYITMPFSTALLAARVMNLVNLRRQMQLERKNRTRLQPGEITVSPLDDEFYKKLQDTVEMHLSDPDFNVKALSRALQMSQATLYRKIHTLTGKNPTSFISSYRIKRAKQLLEAHAGNIFEVAGKVGFLDKSYFARCFKEQFQCLPSDVRSSGVSDENKQKFLRGAQKKEVEKGGPPGGRRQDTILVVGESDDIRRYLRESLGPDYHVVGAADGGEGMARAVEIVPDLVISDIMMTGMDGYELCRLLKKDVRTGHIPIVLLTAKASEESIIRGLESGADDYIIMPFNLKILRARIENLIRLRGHLRRIRDRETAPAPAKISESGVGREFLKELDAVVRENLSDPEFNVDRMARMLHMNRVTLYRKILAITGESPAGYIRSRRLRRAAQLLETRLVDVTGVAFEVGFSSSSHFAKCFKEVYHQSPSDYQAARRNDE